MMREKYESLAVHDLKEIARSRGIKGVSAMKKAEVIEAMLALDAEGGGRHELNEVKKETERPEGKKREAAKPEEGNRRSQQPGRHFRQAGRTGSERTERAEHAERDERQQERTERVEQRAEKPLAGGEE